MLNTITQWVNSLTNGSDKLALLPVFKAIARRHHLADALDAALFAVAGCEDPFERVRAEVMLTGYHYRWHAEDLEPLAVEAEFTDTLVDPKIECHDVYYPCEA